MTTSIFDPLLEKQKRVQKSDIIHLWKSLRFSVDRFLAFAASNMLTLEYTYTAI